MPDPIYITAEGAEKIQRELAELTGSARDELAKRLRSAIQMGDLSENADYHKAKEDQGFLEGRIQELEYVLRNAIIVQEDNGPKDVVSVGVKITLQEEGNPPEIYTMVGIKEADPRNGKISNDSPIGRALMNHREGDMVEVVTPNGKINLKILKIE